MPTVLAAYTDTKAVVLEQTGEVAAGELAALVSVEDFHAFLECNGLPNGIQIEVDDYRFGYMPVLSSCVA